jgi:hypothetical protein
MSAPIRALLISASAELLVSCALGLYMLVLMQRWGKGLQPARLNPKLLLAVHIDWLMLALLQTGIAAIFALSAHELPWHIVALFIFGGWMNALPYLFKAFGVDAMRLEGAPLQIFAALLGALSVAALLYALTYTLMSLL